jgi:serine/threonine protein kinase
VLLARHKPTSGLFALKVITKRSVLAHQELRHTLTEQAVLKRMAAEGKDPFVVKLWWSFHDREHLFLVMDFHPGGDLATQMARWGWLGRDRARSYAAEIVEGVEGLHKSGVIYQDFKPENVLIGPDGHIVLTDFGLLKEFPRRSNAIAAPSGVPKSSNPEKDLPTGIPSAETETTSTLCGAAEYIAPEVIQGLPYGFEVGWWSFGMMLYETLTGIVWTIFTSLESVIC